MVNVEDWQNASLAIVSTVEEGRLGYMVSYTNTTLLWHPRFDTSTQWLFLTLSTWTKLPACDWNPLVCSSVIGCRPPMPGNCWASISCETLMMLSSSHFDSKVTSWRSDSHNVYKGFYPNWVGFLFWFWFLEICEVNDISFDCKSFTCASLLVARVFSCSS